MNGEGEVKLADFGFKEEDVEGLVDLTLQTPSLSGLLAKPD